MKLKGECIKIKPMMLIYRIPLENNSFVPMPKYSTEGAAAMDFYSGNIENISIKPGEIKMIPLGIKVKVPKGYKLTIKPRSGLAVKHGLTITNSPGTVDSDYRGEVQAIIQNCGSRFYVVEPFTRICQGEVEIAIQYPVKEVFSAEELGDTVRGEGGFNSTGTK